MSIGTITWEQNYEQFVTDLGQRAVHPFNDDFSSIAETTRAFAKIFCMIPDSDERKSLIAAQPIFPVTTRFKDYNTYTTQWRFTDPLRHALFTCDIDLVNTLAQHLLPTAWSERGPYNSSRLHLIISGIKQGSASYSGVDKVVACAQAVLDYHPDSLKEENSYLYTPAMYLAFEQGALKRMRTSESISSGIIDTVEKVDRALHALAALASLFSKKECFA